MNRIWDDGYLYNNGKKGTKKCVFVCSFVWLHCASPLCTFVSFMTLCIHTIIHEDDFKVKTLKRIWPQGANMSLKSMGFFHPIPPPFQGPVSFALTIFLKQDIYQIFIFFNSPLLCRGLSSIFHVTHVKVKHVDGWGIWHVILEKVT